MLIVYVVAGLVLGLLAGLAMDRLRSRNMWLAVLLAIGLTLVFASGTVMAAEGSNDDLVWGIMAMLGAFGVTGVGLMAIRDRSSHA